MFAVFSNTYDVWLLGYRVALAHAITQYWQTTALYCLSAKSLTVERQLKGVVCYEYYMIHIVVLHTCAVHVTYMCCTCYIHVTYMCCTCAGHVLYTSWTCTSNSYIPPWGLGPSSMPYPWWVSQFHTISLVSVPVPYHILGECPGFMVWNWDTHQVYGWNWNWYPNTNLQDQV